MRLRAAFDAMRATASEEMSIGFNRRTLTGEPQRESAVVAEAIEQPAVRIPRGRFAVLPLIEEEPGLLALSQIHLVLDRPLAHDNGIGHGPSQHLHYLLESFERPHLRIVARQDSCRREQSRTASRSPRGASGPCPATAPARPGTNRIDRSRGTAAGRLPRGPVGTRSRRAPSVSRNWIARSSLARSIDCVERCVTAHQHPNRNLRAIAEEGMPERPPPWADDFDDVAAGGVHVRDIGAIDPRMARSETLLTTGAL